jgi:hypothetical protein
MTSNNKYIKKIKIKNKKTAGVQGASAPTNARQKKDKKKGAPFGAPFN